MKKSRELLIVTMIMLFGIVIFNQSHAIEEISAKDLKMEKITMPDLVEGNKSPTLNGTGYIFYTISPVGDAFLKNECIPDKTVIEIGAGYSNIPLEALKTRVSKYTANDICKEHLQILVQRIEESAGSDVLQSLNLLHGKAPKDLPKVVNAYDAILADKVIHFMSPSEIKEFIAWSKLSLKKGGKVYVTTASPYSKRYANILNEYLQRAASGKEFPGHFTNMMQNLDNTVDKNYSQYTVPDEMVLFSRTELIDLFEKNGMKVLASYALQIPTTTEMAWEHVPDEESNVVGIIATV